MPPNAIEIAALLAIAAALVARIFGFAKIGWLGIPAIAGAAWATFSGQMAWITGACVILTGLLIAWRANRRSAIARRLAEATVGSLVAAIGGSTLIGYLAAIPSALTWGGTVTVPAWSAAALLLIGAALVTFAWRENARDDRGPPIWAPLPVVICGLMLVLTLWFGLREREESAFRTRTLQAAATLAQGLTAAVEREQNAFDRLARDWGSVQQSARMQQIDAAGQYDKSAPLGCVAVARLDAAGHTLWAVPGPGNERLLAFDQTTVPERREALQRSRQPVIGSGRNAERVELSATTDVRGRRQGGFVIYAPIDRDGQPDGWVAGEFLYEPLVRSVAEDDLKLGDEYYIAAAIGAEPVYSGGGMDPAAGARYTVTRAFAVFDRRLTVAVTPADPQRLRDLRSLPDFALSAGLILTGLLGLSAHFARSARAGQQQAERSNRLLTLENEERRRVESRLKLSDERLRLALDSTEIGIFEWSVPSGHVFYSTGLWAMFGYDPARMAPTAAAWEALLHPDDAPAFRARIEAQVSGGATFIDLEHRVRTAAGEWRWVYTRSKAISADSGGKPNRLIGTVQDVTARVETEHQLRRAKTEADATSRAKSEFLASMSHEIRTPMNGIIGMTSLIMDTPLNEEQRDYVSTIRSSSEALLTIVNDILDFSKIESGKLELERIPFGLALCLEETLELFAGPAAEKGIELVYRLEPDVPAWLRGDVTRLWQIVSNLVNNAVKFTSTGAITVEVRKLAELADGRVQLEFTVKDSGIGIPAERMGRLFKAFSQVDSSTTRRFGGTGLGLAICERLCHLLGGAIRAESAPGEGSSFIFTITTEVAVAPADVDAPPPLPRELHDGVVVAIEDHPVTGLRLSELYGRWGVRCEVARSAAEADAIVARLDRPPAMLVIDHPPGQGPLPELGTAKLNCPRLILVASGKTIDPPSGGRAVEFVVKPLKNSAVVQATVKLFDRNKSVARPTGGTGDGVLANDIPLRVLLAEDNAVNQKVALGLLQRLGYRADLVSNGKEAVDHALRVGYDLILMDLQMPEMDGLEASRQIRKRLVRTPQPRIIALTANAMQGDRELCLAAGMDDYVAKPVKLTEVAAAIRRQFPAASAR